MAYPAKVVPQLGDGRWGGYDCWVASTRGLIHFASNGEVDLTYVQVRKRAGMWANHATQQQLDDKGPGNLINIKQVLTDQRTKDQFKAAGYRPPKVRYLHTTKLSKVCRYLQMGYQAAVAIDYAALKDVRANVTGDPTFFGKHSVRWYGALDPAGNPKVDISAPFLTLQLDPLNDGRRHGIPKGPQRINRKVMRTEAGKVQFTGGGSVGLGSVLALVVAPAERLDKKVTAPKEPDERTSVDEAKVEQIRDSLDGDPKPSAQDVLASIRQILDDADGDGSKDEGTIDESAAADGPDGPDDTGVDAQADQDPPDVDDDPDD